MSLSRAQGVTERKKEQEKVLVPNQRQGQKTRGEMPPGEAKSDKDSEQLDEAGARGSIFEITL